MLDAYINGQSLRGIFPRIILDDVDERASEFDDMLSTIGGRHGQLLLSHAVNGREITLSILIAGKRDYASRAMAIERINRWAQSGDKLTLSYRPEQFIRVKLSQPISMGSVRGWAAAHQLTFSAYELPFWQAAKPCQLEIEGTQPTGFLRLIAGHRSYMCARITPASGTLTRVEISTQLSTMIFDGLEATAGQPLIIDYDGRNLLRAIAGGEDALQCRLPESDNDLLVDPGDNSIRIVASTSVRARLTSRGLYL